MLKLHLELVESKKDYSVIETLVGDQIAFCPDMNLELKLK
jgi:hypothetical protein